jgi:hypothetical protein
MTTIIFMGLPPYRPRAEAVDRDATHLGEVEANTLHVPAIGDIWTPNRGQPPRYRVMDREWSYEPARTVAVLYVQRVP